MESSRSYLFKKKSATDGVQKRVVRAHQQVVEQKNRRDEAVHKKRKIQPDDADVRKQGRRASEKTKQVSRKEMLAKWKVDRDLKRKLEAKEKKPVFKVRKVDRQQEERDLLWQSNSKTVTATGQKTDKGSTKRKADVSTRKPSEVTQRQTRRKSSAPTVPPSTRVTRSSKAPPPTNSTKKGTVNTQKRKEPIRSICKKTSPKNKAESEASAAEQCQFNANTICTDRGGQKSTTSGSDSDSFAPADFVFTAPATVKPFVIRPLSPRSATRIFSASESSEEDWVQSVKSVTTQKRSRTESLAESSFKVMSFYGNKENKTPKHYTPSAKLRRSSRRMTSVARNSSSEGEAEVSLATGKVKHVSSLEQSSGSQGESAKGSCDQENGAVSADSGTGDVEEQLELAAPPATPGDRISQIGECDEVKEVTSTDKVGHTPSISKSNDIDSSSKTTLSVARSTQKFRRVTAKALARLKSPEERMEVLAQSPMIEMSRRTRKTPPPVVDFLPPIDDDDFLGPPPPMPDMDEPEPVTTDPTRPQPTTPVPTDITASTANPMPTDPPVSTEPEHDVKYFRALMASETERLNTLSALWDKTNEETPDLNEDVRGQIRTTSGQAQLLIAQRFKQFSGLVDNCEFNTGLKPVDCSDLQGFWDMIYYQVEDVNEKFNKLEKLKASGWVVEKPAVKKVAKKKTTASGKPSAKFTARSKFAEFRAKMRQQQQKGEQNLSPPAADIKNPVTPKVDKTSPIIHVPTSTTKKPATPKAEDAENISDELKTFEGGFFQIASPVKTVLPSPTGSTPRKTTTTPSERRSLLKTALRNSAIKSAGNAAEMPKSFRKARLSLSVPSPLLPGSMEERPSSENIGASPRLAALARPILKNKTPTISETADQKTSSTTPALEALSLDDQKPTSARKTPARRSSVRKTPKAEKSVTISCSSDDMDVDEDFVAKYCVPTVRESASKSVIMEVDPFEEPINDEEMPTQMKRDLKNEFDKHSKSAHKNINRKSMVSALKSTKRTPAASRRRSVRFMQSPKVNEEMAAPLPRTPFNLDSTVPQLRRSGHLSRGSSGSSSKYVLTPGPAKSSSKDLSIFDSPTSSTNGQQGSGGLLSTPASVMPATSRPSGDLICFTPETTDETTERRKVDSARRKSSRLLAENEASLLTTPAEMTGASRSSSDLICFTPDETPKRRNQNVDSARRKSSRLVLKKEASLF